MQAPAPPEGMQNNLASLYSQNATQRPARKNYRNLPQAPERILDAPELVDDYYLNLLDWGPTNNVVCVTFVQLVHIAQLVPVLHTSSLQLFCFECTI